MRLSGAAGEFRMDYRGRKRRGDDVHRGQRRDVLITRDGRRFAFADAVEAPRMKEEQQLEELGFEILTQQWFENRKENYMKKIVGSLDKMAPTFTIATAG